MPPSTDETVDKELSIGNIEDLLNEEDPNDEVDTEEGKEDTKDKTDKDDKPEKEDEELELEETEESENLEIKSAPRKKEIEKVFPGFFKKFPEVEREYYKAQQFTEVVGTVEDAKELVQKAEVLEAFENNLSEGNTEEILKQVQKNSPEAFEKIVDNYLEALGKVDRSAYFNVIEGVVKRGIISALSHAKETEDEELFNSAKAYYKWMFPQDKEIKMPERKQVQEDDKLKKEREEFNRERFETAESDVQGKVDNIIRSNISNYIDPENKMTSYVKKNAIKDAMQELESAISRDTSFKKSILDPLWKKAHDEKFSRMSLDRIKSAYLTKAKTILKPVIIKARKEALKGLGPVREERDRKGPITVGRTSTSSSERGRIKEPEKGMKTLDYLNSD
jgi:hypothetical protein